MEPKPEPDETYLTTPEFDKNYVPELELEPNSNLLQGRSQGGLVRFLMPILCPPYV